ncbi:hypothetical protein Hanom_Chr01g00060211 [Helianthus anomalus]
MGRDGSWVKTGSGQNGSIKKGAILVWVKTGLGRNGFRSERVQVGKGFGSGWLKMFF